MATACIGVGSGRISSDSRPRSPLKSLNINGYNGRDCGMKMLATAYLRTSSATNVDGDSPHRQSDAIMAFAARQGIEVVSSFWDAAVSGADPIEAREGFLALL